MDTYGIEGEVQTSAHQSDLTFDLLCSCRSSHHDPRWSRPPSLVRDLVTSATSCCTAEFSRTGSRRRLAAPLARRQRRALASAARPPHAGPHRQGTQINPAHTSDSSAPQQLASSRSGVQVRARVQAALRADHVVGFAGGHTRRSSAGSGARGCRPQLPPSTAAG